MVRVMWNGSKYEGHCAGLKGVYGNFMCYDEAVEDYCCGTCGKFHAGIKGCEYGDWYGHCNHFTQDEICYYFSHICCLFCHPDQGDLRLSGPPSGQDASDEARTRDRRVPANLRADSLATVPPTPSLK
ncbi:hypothetical protein PoB_000085900 [Plakobranchus ocellatus]|uniref:Uncharacterized protein n=1 Tax=Plakobranchus ocellatus TaxID=259542 RepID=A0AAV3XTQ4_9GAST|nr:hypothetical protein PoB_000085900 [Plakobranchus ocellatus]